MGHTERVVDAAAREDVLGDWPFDTGDPRALIKLRPTPRSAGMPAPAKRAAAREIELAVDIPDPDRTRGKRILVYDDLCTTGSQLNSLAEVLVGKGGASVVEAVVLARAPWRSDRELG